MITSYNIELQEQVDYTLSKSLPIIAGADLYRATGETEEKHWTGPWSEVKAQYDSLEYSNFKRLRATLKRTADGDFGELSAVWSMYEAGDGSTGEAGEETEQPGESRDCPEYDLQVQTVAEPLLTHPKWVGLSDDKMTALKMVMDGYKRTESFQLEDGTHSTIYEVLKDISPAALLRKVLQGVTAYNSPHIVLTVRYRSDIVPAIVTVGTIVSEVPGGFATPSGRNWYFHGPSWTMKGSELWVTEVYELSGPGGWDDFIYSSAS